MAVVLPRPEPGPEGYKGEIPRLKNKVIVPDVLLQSHIAFDRPDVLRRRDQFPKEYQPRRLRLGARLVEPPHVAPVTRSSACPMKDGKAHGRIRGLRHRFRDAGRRRVGTPRGGHRSGRWIACVYG